jgi:hydroxyacylglutathione hydrolase
MALIFEVIRGGGDNLAYIVGCSKARVAAVVDPISAHDILETCDQKKLKILFVLNTHGHPDHTAGNDVIVSAHGAKVMAHSAERIIGLGRRLRDRETIPLGEFFIEALHTPGHTEGSLCFKVQNKLMTGDTLFLSGAGNTRFGGSIKDLFRTFQNKILALPGRLAVCPGHDYAENNLRFARTLEPDNPFIDRKLKAWKETHRNGGLLHSTLAEERRYNPFLRFKNPVLLESLKAEFPELNTDNPYQVFKLIRELRNNW